jgi:uncharacterized protein (TIGR02266 family)
MSTSSAARKTILVAADTPFVRDRFKTALDAAGHRAMIVKSVAQLFAHVRADLADMDLIVLDLKMPHASGVDLVRRIRKLDDGTLPILVLSGTVSSVDEVRELAALGVSGYLNEYSAVDHVLPSLAPHLYPEAFSKRESPRVVTGLAVSYRVGKQITAALSLDLSRGGIAIRTPAPPPRGTTLKVRFALPGSKKEMQTEGIVCWSVNKSGMGIMFTDVRPADQDAINTFVDAHFFRSTKKEK